MSISEEKTLRERVELQLCRVCNVPSKQSLSLYKPHIAAGELTTLAELLSYCANLQVLEEEGFLPAHICKRCVELLTQLYDFKRTAIRTDQILRKRHARSSKAVDSHSPTPEKSEQLDHVDTEIDVDVDIDSATSATMESVGTDEYVYVLEEAKSPTPSSIASNAEDCDTVSEDILEHELHFGREEPNVEVFEVDYDLAEDYENAQLGNNIEPDIGMNLRSQQRHKSINPALQCTICGKQLSTSNSFKYHMQLHGDRRPFVCSFCGESFKTRNAYDGHITVHNPNNPNKCTICGKIYRQASSLRSHLYSHKGVKPFTCNICGKGLTQKSGYKKHMLTHTGEKPHTCITCGRSFRYSSNLFAHMRSHTRKAPANVKVTASKSPLMTAQRLSQL